MLLLHSHNRNLVLTVGVFVFLLVIVQIRFAINNRKLQETIYELQAKKTINCIGGQCGQLNQALEDLKTVNFAIGGKARYIYLFTNLPFYEILNRCFI